MNPEITSVLYGGVQIQGSQALPTTTTRPLKRHRKKRWMRDAYHNRIQKKWTKRFGVEVVRPMYNVQGAIFTHPDNVKWLRDKLAQVYG